MNNSNCDTPHFVKFKNCFGFSYFFLPFFSLPQFLTLTNRLLTLSSRSYQGDNEQDQAPAVTIRPETCIGAADKMHSTPTYHLILFSLLGRKIRYVLALTRQDNQALTSLFYFHPLLPPWSFPPTKCILYTLISSSSYLTLYLYGMLRGIHSSFLYYF